ncbi:DNA-deoxyinosine glycosylase [Candidatus Nitrotoga sp. M5]|uniref:DNA-deoxyinosine glycosylase n=1 Tax=Candidatus Nitrotoga sp. M5 TaxID=2890409 RepID=UPI001EF5AC8F|nr:DNA-deoxyinosine glycosylase [Candidatus Nitrotoga sp. M5]CAH1387559.1 G:T/U mismatch-specific uracil/thymine DNA-glycosylase [Candidatus Nitrotoga sp. M5]
MQNIIPNPILSKGNKASNGRMNIEDTPVVHTHSFPPIESDNSSILILGTMPGKASLQAQQYYAHPRNAFWKIISEILGVNAENTYEVRTSSIVKARIALWDVLKSCTREGSLDSNIANDTIVLNDIASFFNNHSHIHKVYFNGAKAEILYMRHVQPSLRNCSSIEYIRLPSTSPANAAISYDQKLEAWKAIACCAQSSL